MRAFVAIALPPDACRDLWQAAAPLRIAGVRASWVTPERMHLTLRFLGDITDAQVTAYEAAVRPDLERIPAFACTLRGIGAFPKPARPAVIWAGLEPLAEELSDVQRAADSGARAIGLPPENRAFKPHVTIGRIRQARIPEAVQQNLAALGQYEGGSFSVATVSLFASDLTPKGPVYTKLHEFFLRHDH